MGNKCVRALNQKEYEAVISCLKDGYVLKRGNKKIVKRGNLDVAMAFYLESMIGLRCGDICRLTLNNFYKKNEKDWYVRLKEQKTGKYKEIYIPTILYEAVMEFCLMKGISNKKQSIIKCGIRNVQRQLKDVREHLDLGDDISTHSGRKFFAQKVYDTNGEHDLLLVQSLLLHSSPATTRRYLRIGIEKQKDVMELNVVSF